MAGLFGGRRPSAGGIGTFLLRGVNGLDAQRQAQQQTMLADRLRAQLSPMDGPNGSGTGAMPSIEEQMRALDDARLLNPEVAQQFAPQVAERSRQQQAASLFANDPKAQMLFTQGNEQFLNSLGEQYKPQVIGAGGRQSVYGEGRTVDAPSFSTVNDTIFRNDSGSGQSVPTATAPPAYADVTSRMVGQGNLGVAQGRLALDQSQSGFTLGQGQTRYDVNGNPIAEAPRAPSAQDNELQGQLASLDTDVDPTLTQMESLLKSGDVITGFAAQTRLDAARAAAALGNRDAQRQIAATQQYQNLSGRLRVGMAKSLGANPSNADIQLLERVTAGDIGQSMDGLLATIQDGRNMASRQRQTLMGRVQGGQPQQPQGQPSRADLIAEARRRGLIQ